MPHESEHGAVNPLYTHHTETLREKKYIPADELISYLNLQMELRGYEVGLSIRTLQRDIAEIERMFEIEIKNRRG